MNEDMSVKCGEGFINLRVGAIILKDGKLLMVRSTGKEYLYTVGGRIKFGEMAEEAVEREVFEETGVKMKADRLGFIQELYFLGDADKNRGKQVYEICFFFYMKVPNDFTLKSETFSEENGEQRLVWISQSCEGEKVYPNFFKTELSKEQSGIKYFVRDDRNVPKHFSE